MSYKRRIRLGVNTLFLVPGDVGGTETFLRETLKAFHQFHHDRFQLVLFTNNENDSVLRDDFSGSDSVTFHKLGFNASNRPKRIILEQFWLPFFCKNEKLDILWSPGYTAPFWVPCPQAVTIPDLQYKSFPDDMSPLERVVLDSLVRIACRRSKIIFTISEFSKREVMKYGFAGNEKIFPALLGVDSSFGDVISREEKASVLSELLPDDKPYLLCVSHSYPHKNINLLIDAFDMISSDIPHNLVIVGTPRRGESMIVESIGKLNEKHRLIRLQGLPYKQLQILYQDADIFVLPSAYEGFGLPVLEAMMAGTPVITSREGSLEEVGGIHAHYIEDFSAEAIAEKIKALWKQDEESKRAQVEKAREWAQSFTWKRSADDMARGLASLN